jgi:hypothetical protein
MDDTAKVENHNPVPDSDEPGRADSHKLLAACVASVIPQT